jgi:hypothetical protein
MSFGGVDKTPSSLFSALLHHHHQSFDTLYYHPYRSSSASSHHEELHIELKRLLIRRQKDRAPD